MARVVDRGGVALHLVPWGCSLFGISAARLLPFGPLRPAPPRGNAMDPRAGGIFPYIMITATRRRWKQRCRAAGFWDRGGVDLLTAARLLSRPRTGFFWCSSFYEVVVHKDLGSGSLPPIPSSGLRARVCRWPGLTLRASRMRSSALLSRQTRQPRPDLLCGRYIAAGPALKYRQAVSSPVRWAAFTLVSTSTNSVPRG